MSKEIYSYSSKNSIQERSINLEYILELFKTGKDNKEKEEEYKVLFNKLHFLFFNPIELIKQYPEEEKNKYTLTQNFSIAQRLNNNNNIESILQIISVKEKEYFYPEEEPAIPKLINLLQFCQKKIYRRKPKINRYI